MRRTLLLAVAIFLCAFANASNRWIVDGDGITWRPSEDIPHSDYLEMTGFRTSLLLRYGVAADGSFSLSKTMVFPLMRTIPDNTHASYIYRNPANVAPLLSVNEGQLLNEKVERVHLDGIFEVESTWELGAAMSSWQIKDGQRMTMIRTIFPSTQNQAVIEMVKLRNTTSSPAKVYIPEFVLRNVSDADVAIPASHVVETRTLGAGAYSLNPGEELHFSIVSVGFNEGEEPISVDVASELEMRRDFIDSAMGENLIFECGDPALETMFRLAKIRASESIIATSGGLMHAPGGEAYYAALWCNDQCQYVNPLFPFLGYVPGNEQSMNCYRHFARFMTEEYKPIPCSVIAEGRDIWNGAGDRGDAAMYADGAGRYALASGSVEEALELWDHIEWCLEYTRRRLGPDGVPASDSDELEGRFSSGNYNLSTAVFYYDGLVSAKYLCSEFARLKLSGRNWKKLSKQYSSEAEALSVSIEKFFASDIKGYSTYRYHDGCEVLRSWICLPLIVGISSAERSKGTIAALMAPEMLSDDGILTEEGDITFWDRSTLYALRAFFNAGYSSKAIDFLKTYSQRRLLGEHVPYAVEAFPEGAGGLQRHLSGESGLYCRVITEGLFGIRPCGLNSFEIKPSLPEDMPSATLRHVRLFGDDFDITLSHARKGTSVRIDYHDSRKSHTHVVPFGQSIVIII